MIVLMKLCIVYLQFPVTPLLKGVQCSPTDITLIKCQQHAMHCARHRGGGRDESTSSTTSLPTPPTPQRRLLTKRPALQPGCCCFHIQLKHIVLPGMLSVFPRGTSESPPLSSFCTVRLVLTHRSCPMPSWLTYITTNTCHHPDSDLL